MTATKKLLCGMNKIIFNDTEDAKGMSPKGQEWRLYDFIFRPLKLT